MDKVTICVSVFDRPEYTKPSLQSLNTKYPVLVVDDCSTVENQRMLLLWLKPGWSFHQLTQNIGITQMIKKFSEECATEYIYIADNDMEYQEGFDDALQEGLGILAKNKKTIISLYNSAMHEVIGTYNSKWCYKDICGGCSLLVSTKLLQEFVKSKFYPNTHDGWDIPLHTFLNDQGIKYVCSIKSYAKHIGMNGLHSNANFFDQSVN